MLLRMRARFLSGLCVLAGSPLASQPANAPTLVALSGLESGQWTLRAGEGAESRAICLGDPSALLQPRHGGANCSRFVIANDPKSATIHYTCPGAGHGRTTLRVETSRLVQIESQGIVNKAPFSVRYEARRTGACGTPSASAKPLTPRLPSRAKPAPVLSFK